MIREHAYLLVFLCCVLFLCFLVQNRYYQYRETDVATTNISTRPDQFINHVEWLTWESEGEPVNQLLASRLEHFPDKKGTILFQPRLKIEKTKSEIWRAQSDTAWVQDSQQQINLENNIHVTLQSKTSTTLISEQLTIDTQKHRAYTDSLVTIKSKRGVITSVGIDADFKTGKIVLQNQVRGQHDTSSD
ncbi:MAG: LPS export ABC transporter periplasmic protein LptC [Gammaproteobacteria bacterium]